MNNFDLTVKENNTEIVDGENMILDLTTRQTQYCSVVAQTDEEKALLFNATNNTAHRLSDCINMVINVKDVFVEVVNCTNQETGEVTACPRIVLINDKGEGYQCVSMGIFSALKKLFAIYGEPKDWSKPIKLEVKQVTKGERKMLTLNIKN